MNDPARDALEYVLADYGVSILDTPRSLATILHKHARLFPQDVDALLAAVNNGVTTQIRTNPQYDPASLARVLVQCAKLSPGKAIWAVNTWCHVLSQPKKPRQEVEEKSGMMGTLIVVVGAAAIGMFAFLYFGH